MKFAQALANWIAKDGPKHVFGVIGAGNLAIWDAISEKGETEIVACHHEQAAAMAAAYYARATGGLGLVLVTTGAGSSNAITGVLAAHMDGVPLMVVSGNEPSKYIEGSSRVLGVQGYRSKEVATLFTKLSARMESTSLALMEELAKSALQAPQGAVWVDIPKDLQNASI